MSKGMKKWLIIAASLVVIGLLLFASVMTVYHWDFTKLSTEKYKTNTYNVNEVFDSISVDTDTTDVYIIPSEDENCRVVCYLQESVNISVMVKNGKLRIHADEEKRKWYENIGINFDSAHITVYLPAAEYREFIVNTSTGDIRVENVSTETLALSVSTGKINVTDVECNELTSDGSTGDVSLHQVAAENKISIQRSTGDVEFENTDAPQIMVKTNTGDVTGNLLSGKLFIVQTQTGSVDVPETAAGGKCEIHTNTGDIRIDIQD